VTCEGERGARVSGSAPEGKGASAFLPIETRLAPLFVLMSDKLHVRQTSSLSHCFKTRAGACPPSQPRAASTEFPIIQLAASQGLDQRALEKLGVGKVGMPPLFILMSNQESFRRLRNLLQVLRLIFPAAHHRLQPYLLSRRLCRQRWAPVL
jgi:hypothetical protein